MATAWINPIDNSVIQYFDSNGFVGIGLTAPSEQLHVNSNIRANGNIWANGYCNLMIDSYSNSSVFNAPTCGALSNVYGMLQTTSNLAYNSSNYLYPSADYSSNKFNWCSNAFLPLSGGTINGGLTVNSNCTIMGKLTVCNVEYVTSNITIYNSEIIQSNLTVFNTATMCNSLDVYGPVNMSNSLNVSNLATFNSNLTVLGNLRVKGLSTLGSNISLSNSTGVVNIYSSNTNIGINTPPSSYTVSMNGILCVNSTNIQNKLLVLYEPAGSSNDNPITANNFYGFGISGGILRYQTPIGNAHVFYNGSIETIRFSSNSYIGINNSVPLYPLDVNGSGRFTSNLIISGLLSNVGFTSLSNLALMNSNVAYYASNLATTSSNALFPSTIYSSNTATWASNNLLPASTSNRIFNGFSNNGNTLYTYSNIAQGMVTATENLSILSNMSLSNYGKVVLSSSNNCLGIGIVNPRATLDVFGNIYSANYCKLNKSLESSNAINMTLNWSTPYSLGNQYFVILETNQTIANQLFMGAKRSRYAVGISNYSIAFQESADVFGSMSAFTTLNIAQVASNSTSVTLQSSTNWVTGGVMSHQYGVEIISAPSYVGSVWLT